jgi:hypothetical protein
VEFDVDEEALETVVATLRRRPCPDRPSAVAPITTRDAPDGGPRRRIRRVPTRA